MALDEAETPMVQKHTPRRCLNFWTCHYQATGHMDGGKLFFWTVILVATIYGLIAGVIVGPFALDDAYNPLMYEDTCKILAYDGNGVLVRPQSSIYYAPNLTVEAHCQQCSSFIDWRTGTAKCFVQRTGNSLTDLSVWFKRPHLSKAVFLLSTGIPILTFIVTWMIANWIYHSTCGNNSALVAVFAWIVIVVLILYGGFGFEASSLALWNERNSYSSEQCVVSHCSSDGNDVATIEMLAPSTYTPRFELVQLRNCDKRLNKVVTCYDDLKGHLCLSVPGSNAKFGVWMSSLLVVSGFVVLGLFVGVNKLKSSCDAADEAEVAAAVAAAEAQDAIGEKENVDHDVRLDETAHHT